MAPGPAYAEHLQDVAEETAEAPSAELKETKGRHVRAPNVPPVVS